MFTGSFCLFNIADSNALLIIFYYVLRKRTPSIAILHVMQEDFFDTIDPYAEEFLVI